MDYYDKEALGARIKAIRGNTTLVAWGEKLGVSKSAIDQWEKGRNWPSGEFLLKLWIHHKDVDLVELLSGTYKQNDNNRKEAVLTADERQLLGHYANLPVDDKKSLQRYALAMSAAAVDAGTSQKVRKAAAAAPAGKGKK